MNQKGYIEEIFGLILVSVIVAFVTVYTLAAFSNHHEFNRWNEDCNRAGGQISQTRSGFLSTRYECFINNKQVTLPGWEGK